MIICRTCKSTFTIVNYNGKVTCLSCGTIETKGDTPPSIKSTLKCECGIDKTYKKPPAYYHSDWCPKYEKKKD